MERVESVQRLLALMAGPRPVWSNVYRLPADFGAAAAAGRLYAHEQPGALMLLEEWPDVYQTFLIVRDPQSPCAAPRMSRPLLAECVTRGAAPEKGFSEFWARMGFRLSCTRRMLERTGPMPDLPAQALTVRMADGALAREARALFEENLDRLTVRLPWRLEEAEVLCALDGAGRLAGALHFSRGRGAQTLEHLAVWPQMRRLGVASALMARWLGPEGKYRLWVLEENLPALALYGRWGFGDTGRRCDSLLCG